MNQVEDAASVLEQFQQDVSNLPGEIHHLYEEIQAKDRIIQDCRNTIASRDSSIQKWITMNGAGQPNPKQEAYCKIIRENYEKAEKIQAEKIAMAEKAALLFDRQVKRLDFKIRDLQNEGAIQPDPQLPSLLHNTSITTRLPPLPTNHSPSIPLHPLSGNIGPSTTIANNPIARLVQPAARQPSPLITALPPSAAAQQAAHLSALRNTNRSPSTDPSKRRRLNAHHLSIPATSSSLRQSSLGPGTPKASDLATSRGSSAGPSRPSNNKKPSARNTAPPHHRIGHLNPTATKKNTTRRRGGNNKKSGTPVSTGEEDSAAGDENDEDVEMEDAEDEGDGDDKKYCVCQSVSYGNMVACDNATCPYEWFHWSCVGVKQEPAGKWYCPDCRKQR